jgi:hypothetical protein
MATMLTTKAQRKAAKRRASVERAERTGPTPETAAKLIPCPLFTLFDLQHIDAAQYDAAIEVREIYIAAVGECMRGGSLTSTSQGKSVMPEKLAELHAAVYMPWAARWGRAMVPLMDMIVDGTWPYEIVETLRLQREWPVERRNAGIAGQILTDYAKRKREWLRVTRREAA